MRYVDISQSPDRGRPYLPAPFIVGASRSGTTLLRLMLDAHSELAIPPETNFSAAADAFVRGGASAAVDALVQGQQWGDCNLAADEFALRVEDLGPTSIGELLRVFYRLYAEKRGKFRWGDKSPYYVAAMSRIQRVLPEARFVHIVRDGRDVALSTMPLWFGPDTIAAAAKWWSQTIESARRQAQDLTFYTEVRYESLVCDPSATLRQLCGFLELEWEESMLDYHLEANRRLSAETVEWRQPHRVVSREERLRIHPLIGQPPQRSRIERWRREMNADDLRVFDSIAGEALEALGYELGCVRGS